MQRQKRQPLLHVFFIGVSMLFVLPFLYVISVSLTSETDIMRYGYQLIPPTIDFSAYQWVFRDVSTIVRAYAVTAFQAGMGTFLGVTVMTLIGYAISRPDYALRRHVSFLVLFTMLFNGGIVPTYVIVTQWFELGNSIWVYIFPLLVNPFFVIIIRTFFAQLPNEIFDSAHMDGAGEIRICFQLALPISTPVIAAVSFLFLQGRWDEWQNALLYIRDSDLYTLQYLLQRILLEIEFLRHMAAQSPEMAQFLGEEELPRESMRYAMAVVAAGPMIFIFPFFQRYFVRGLTVGSLKG